MPCNGGSYFESQERDHLVEKVEILTRRLCHACQILEENDIAIPSELDEWWYEHKLEDEERKDEAKRRAEAESSKKRRERYLESLRERLKNQLSRDELEALGFRDKS